MFEEIDNSLFEPLSRDEAERYIGAGKCVNLTNSYCSGRPGGPLRPDQAYDGMKND
jgi:hypothetical protein